MEPRPPPPSPASLLGVSASPAHLPQLDLSPPAPPAPHRTSHAPVLRAPPPPPQTLPLPCPTPAGLSEQEPLHLHFSGHCLANGLLICSIVPCEANSISASQSSLPVDSVIDWRNSCHRPAACSLPPFLRVLTTLLLGPLPRAHRTSTPLPPAQGSVTSNEK